MVGGGGVASEGVSWRGGRGHMSRGETCEVAGERMNIVNGEVDGNAAEWRGGVFIVGMEVRECRRGGSQNGGRICWSQRNSRVGLRRMPGSGGRIAGKRRQKR